MEFIDIQSADIEIAHEIIEIINKTNGYDEALVFAHQYNDRLKALIVVVLSNFFLSKHKRPKLSERATNITLMVDGLIDEQKQKDLWIQGIDI